MELGLNEIISLLIVFSSLLLAAFLLTYRSANYRSNVLLAFFLILVAQDADDIIIAKFIYPEFPALGLLFNLTVLLKVPAFYLYILSVIHYDFKFKWQHVFHAALFIIVNLLFIPRFYSTGFQGQMDYLNANTLSHKPMEIQISYILVHSQIFAYIVACFIAVNKYRNLLLENYSNYSFFNYRWLFQLILVFVVSAAIASLKNLFMFLGWEQAYNSAMLISMLFLLGYIIWIVLRALRNPEMFKGVDSKLKLVKSIAKEERRMDLIKNEVKQLEEEAAKKIILINNFMIESEPYLDPSLTLSDLSRQINIPSKELSLLINNDLDQHFLILSMVSGSGKRWKS